MVMVHDLSEEKLILGDPKIWRPQNLGEKQVFEVVEVGHHRNGGLARNKNKIS